MKSFHCWFSLIFLAVILTVMRFTLFFNLFMMNLGQILFISLAKTLNYNGVLNWSESNNLKMWTTLFFFTVLLMEISSNEMNCGTLSLLMFLGSKCSHFTSKPYLNHCPRTHLDFPWFALSNLSFNFVFLRGSIWIGVWHSWVKNVNLVHLSFGWLDHNIFYLGFS